LLISSSYLGHKEKVHDNTDRLHKIIEAVRQMDGHPVADIISEVLDVRAVKSPGGRKSPFLEYLVKIKNWGNPDFSYWCSETYFEEEENLRTIVDWNSEHTL